jgi:hypothetical protein
LVVEKIYQYGLVETLGVLRLRLRMTPLLKKGVKATATATAKVKAKARARARASASASGILHCVQNDGVK